MENINKFLEITHYGFDFGFGLGSGSGCNYGSSHGCDAGDGNIDGTCYGFGAGAGAGTGGGSGRGCGYGNDGSGGAIACRYGKEDIKKINGNMVFIVDDIPTIIRHVKNNVAKGWILYNDLTQTPCYIAKINGYFGHGATVRGAVNAATEKSFEHIETERVIEMFLQTFTDMNKKYPANDFYIWRHRLTGSCEMGRQAFIKNHGIDIEHDEFTVMEFIDMTKNDYGGEIMRDLEEKITGNDQ